MPRRGRLPSTQINQSFRETNGLSRDFPRYAAIVAKGPAIKLFRGAEVVRGELEGVALAFSATTYQAALASPAIPDKNRSRLYQSDGRSVSVSRWNFIESVTGSGTFDLVQIDPTLFSSGVSYLLDYVTTDPDVQDPVPVDDLREVLAVGDGVGQVRYREGEDYRFIATAENPLAGDDNVNPTASVLTPVVAAATNTGTGTVAHNSNTYSHGYNRAYRVRVLGVATTPVAADPAGGVGTHTASLLIEAFQTSSGYDALPGRSHTMDNAILVNVDEAIPATLTDIAAELGITLDFGFGASNFVAGDQYTFQGNGPGVLELSDALLNTNQFAAVSAVVDGDSNSGEGSITVNPQSLYTGQTNQSYEVECLSTGGSGTSRTADFRVRAKAALKTITGTATFTNASDDLVGVGTAFLTDLAPGDIVLAGEDPIPVVVLSVTDNANAKLTAVFAQPTQAAVSVLRIRETTSQITVPIATASRVSIGNGILLDFDFGSALVTDNFDADDVFSFTALAARVDYNGKENREYDISATVADVNTLTVSYASDSVLGTFGSHTFKEGAPLVLPNNISVSARNLSLANRFNAVAPVDTFSLSLTFDGLIDWTLEKEQTVTISTADIRRDNTGDRTGVVGAYFVQVRNIPTSVVSVRGPSPTFSTIVFNLQAGTNTIYFTTNPGVNLTITYRFAGNEPTPGSSYFMSGYQKRPDSDYANGQLFRTRDAAADFLAPMTPQNDAAIAAEIAWDQDETSLPGLVVFLVKDSDDDGQYSESDYEAAIRISEKTESTLDAVVVNQFSVRDTAANSCINMNDPTVGQHRILYTGMPTGLPLGDEFTPSSRIYTARRELQVFAATPARGTLVALGNAYAKKVVKVDALGDGNIDAIDTEVTLDGSFLAVALAARVASFSEPWELVLNQPVVGFSEIEFLDKDQMILLQDAGIICINVPEEGSGVGFFQGTSTTDETEASTEQLSGTVQRQYVLARLIDKSNQSVVGYVADSPEDAADKLRGDMVGELGAMVAERKIGRYQNADGTTRPINPDTDVKALRNPSDPVRSYFRASYYNKYGTLFVDGLLAVDAPTP